MMGRMSDLAIEMVIHQQEIDGLKCDVAQLRTENLELRAELMLVQREKELIFEQLQSLSDFYESGHKHG